MISKSWGIRPEILEAYRIFKREERHNTKQDYKKAFKRANTRKVYKSFSMSKPTEMTEGTG